MSMAFAVGSPGAETPYSVSMPMMRRDVMRSAYEPSHAALTARSPRIYATRSIERPSWSRFVEMSEDVLISPEAARPRYDVRLVSYALAADLLSVLVFAIIGRASHDEGFTASGLVTTAWPFVVGVVGG